MRLPGSGFDRVPPTLTFKNSGIVILIMECTNSPGRGGISRWCWTCSEEHDHWFGTRVSAWSWWEKMTGRRNLSPAAWNPTGMNWSVARSLACGLKPPCVPPGCVTHGRQTPWISSFHRLARHHTGVSSVITALTVHHCCYRRSPKSKHGALICIL